MAEYTAGSASVPVTPDMSGFQKDIAAKLDELETEFAKAGDVAGKAFADSFSAQVKAKLDGLDATVKADADTAEADAKLDEVAKKPRSATITVKTVADKVSGKTGTLADLLNPVGLGAAASVALGPSALGAAAGAAGIGVALGAAAADAGAFGAIAIPMFTAVTGAQTALTAAQTAYNKATTDAGRASALKAEQAALASLTPAERQLATELTGLSTAWGQLQKAEQPVVGAAIAPWLKTATSGMTLLKPLITDGANAIELLGNEADNALQSPFWQKFSDTLGTTGEEALQVFGEAAGKVGDGLAHIFVAFAPDIDNLLPDVDKLAGAFDDWASSVNDKGLNSFLTKTFSPANVHALAQDGKDLAGFLENVAGASQDMSPLAFDGLGNVLTVLGDLTPDEIIVLTGLFLAIKGIGTISKVASGISGAVNTVKGLLGSGATAETSATSIGDSTTAGEASGTAFSKGFATGLEGLPGEVTTALAGLGEASAAEANTAGDAVGASFATGFGEGVGEVGSGLLDATGVGAPEVLAAANGAGDALGASFATGFGEGVGEIGGTIAGALPEAGGLALLGVAATGIAFGMAFGGGVVGGFALSGAKGVASGLEGDAKNATSSASGWLAPAGKAAADGFGTGFLGEQSKVQGDVAQVKAWTQAGASGSSGWLTAPGQQTATGFGTGFSGEHAVINNVAGQLKTWVSQGVPAPTSWLVNAGISVVQGLANGMVSAGSFVVNAAESLGNLAENAVKSALGINSPAKRMIPLGSAVPEGVGVGMLDGAGFITDAGAHLANVTAASLGGLATGQALSALGIPSIGSPALLPGVGSPVNGAPLQLQVSYAATGNQLTDALVSGLQFHIVHATGGDVQAALGQGGVR